MATTAATPSETAAAATPPSIRAFGEGPDEDLDEDSVIVTNVLRTRAGSLP